MASLYRRQGRYYAQVYHEEMRYQFALGTTNKRVADRLLARLEDRWKLGDAHPSQGLAALTDEQSAPTRTPSLEKQVALFIESRRLLRPKSITAYRTALARLMDAGGHVENALEPYSPATRATYHRYMMVFFKWREAKGWGGVPVVALPRERHEPRHAYTPEEVEKICKHADATLGLAIRLAFELGLRLTEVASLDKSWIRGSSLYIPPSLTKSGMNDRLPLTDVARELLQRTSKDKPFAKWETPSGLAQAFAKARERAGLSLGSFHSLRHGCAVRLLREGMHIRAVQPRMRHGSLQTTAGYLEQAAEDWGQASSLGGQRWTRD